MKKILSFIVTLLLIICLESTTVSAICQEKSKTLPSNYGTLTSNVWRQSFLAQDGVKVGNTRQWDYQVSAVYTGKKKVSRIRTTWQASACLKNSASISLGISNSSVSVGKSNTWKYIKTVSKYWENSNGAKSASWRSNIYVAPDCYYNSGTISLANTALVKLTCDKRTFEITASV